MKPAIWHSDAHYTPSRLGVDGIIVIEVCAAALIVFAAMALNFI